MKRITAIFLTFILLLSGTVFTSAAEEPATVYGQRMESFIADSLYDELFNDSYAYVSNGRKFETDETFLAGMFLAEKVIEKTAVPDEDRYAELLVTLMALYETDNAADLEALAEHDNLKKPKDYFVDVVKMGVSAIGVYKGLGGVSTELQQAISTAIDGLSIAEGVLEDGVKQLSMLETYIQCYSAHSQFLSAMTKSSFKDLANAAKKLQRGLEEAAVLELQAFGSIYVDAAKKYDTVDFLFSNYALEYLKSTRSYTSGGVLKSFTDISSGVMNILSLLKADWDLAAGIAKMVGNITVGGEDLMNRAGEIMALPHISDALKIWIQECRTEYYKARNENAGADAEEAAVRSFVAAGEYLSVTRIRGEYCIYSIVDHDAGLLSLINRKAGEEAREWFDQVSGKLTETRDALLAILDPYDSASFGEVVSDGNAVYYWRYRYESFDRDGIMGYHMTVRGVENELIRRSGDSENVILTDCGSGDLCAAGGRIYYGRMNEDGSREVVSVNPDGSGGKSYGAGVLLGCIDAQHIIWQQAGGSDSNNCIALLNSTSGMSTPITDEVFAFAGVHNGIAYLTDSDTSAKTMDIYTITPGETHLELLCSPDMSFVEGGYAGPCIAEVRFPVIEGEEWLYFSYGSIAGSGVFYQGGRIARIRPDGSDFEVLAGKDSLVGADFTVDAEGGIYIYPDMESRVETASYTGLTKFRISDGHVYLIREDNGEDQLLLLPEDYQSIGSDEGYFMLKDAVVLDGCAYVRIEYDEPNGEDLGWRPGYTLIQGVLVKKNLSNGEVTFLYTY